MQRQLQTLYNDDSDEHERNYWKGIISAAREFNEILATFTSQAMRQRSCLMIPHDTVARLRMVAVLMNVRLDDILGAATLHALSQVTRRDTVMMTVESSGRPQSVRGVGSLFGWLTTMIPYLVSFHPEISPLLAVATVARLRHSLSHHGIEYARFGSYADVPKATFNYLGIQGAINPAWSQWSPQLIRLPSDRGDEYINDSGLDVTAFENVANSQTSVVLEIDSAFDPCVVERFVAEMRTFVDRTASQDHARNYRLLQEPYQVLLPPHERKSVPTMFLLPPGEGGGESYLHNLASEPCLANSHRVVLFNNAYRVRDRPVHNTFESLAAEHIAYVLRLQPKGPYCLGGWSFGGVLALEMAAQLAKAGQRVSFVFLLIRTSRQKIIALQTRVSLNGSTMSTIPLQIASPHLANAALKLSFSRRN
jgi:N-(5-amino-5-carboxypentanoyl)-L-cysteinyl-D-valine synthase